MDSGGAALERMRRRAVVESGVGTVTAIGVVVSGYALPVGKGHWTLVSLGAIWVLYSAVVLLLAARLRELVEQWQMRTRVAAHVAALVPIVLLVALFLTDLFPLDAPVESRRRAKVLLLGALAVTAFLAVVAATERSVELAVSTTIFAVCTVAYAVVVLPRLKDTSSGE